MLIDKSLHKNASAPVNQNAAADPGAAGGSNGNSSISDMFTTLLAAQIQNQDPLAPMEAGQFVTQFAQLSQVEAMQSMASINAAAAAMQESMLVVTLGSQVGSQVMVATDSVALGDQPVKGGFVLNDSASDTKLVLTGPDGVEHPIDLGPQEAGEVDFDIDPEKLGLPPGNYSMRVDTNTGLLRTCIIIENDRPASWLLSMAPIRSSLWPLSTAAVLSLAACCCASTWSIADFMVCAKPGPAEASACSATPGAMPARVPSMAWSIGLDSSIFMRDSGDKGRGWGGRALSGRAREPAGNLKRM